MFKFFIDTADIDYIKTTIQPLLNDLYSSLEEKNRCLGITTNPNAMHKINCTSLESWEKILPSLCETVSDMRGDSDGLVHVQAPNSKMTGEEVLKFAKHIHKFNDGNTKLALKIAPSTLVLKKVKEIQEYMPVNVTGLSDCSTVLSCLSYGVNFASIIPGRMEEVGIHADSHLFFLMKRGNKDNCHVITGSMRTVEGLRKAISYDTLPTIGTRVWDKIKEIDLSNGFEVGSECENDVGMFSTQVDNKSLELSTQFFEQMDSLGEQAFGDFCKLS
jgi:hypothetical protein